MRTPARRSLPTKLRTGETRIGRWLLPLAVTAAAAFATYSACEAVASSARAVHTRGGAAALVAVSLAGRSPAAGDTGTIHVMSTSNGSPYLNWQTRIMYKTFTMARPRGPLTTLPALNARYRLLHRRTDDELMAEVPTVRVDSLHEACDKWCEFPVADRPNAVAAWLRSADAALGEWIYMIETDYVWMAALPPPAPESLPLAFHFHYINPQWPGLAAVIKRGMWDGETGAIPCTGPAPVLIRKAQLQQLMPKWEQYAAWIESDAEAKERLGWVREMYAYSVAAAAEGVRHNVQEPSTTVLISQPPADDSLREATAFHYTWGSQFKNASGGVVWEFDKRPFTETKHVRRIQEYAPTLPPADAAARGLKLQDGKPVTAELLAVETAMLRRMRDAIAQLPNLPDAPGCGWLDSEPKCAFGCLAGILCVPEGRTFKLPGE